MRSPIESTGNEGVQRSDLFLFRKKQSSLLIESKETKTIVLIAPLMGRRPDETFVVDQDECFGCGACIALCPLDVLTLIERVIVVDEPACSHCELCIPSCPVEALLFEAR